MTTAAKAATANEVRILIAVGGLLIVMEEFGDGGFD